MENARSSPDQPSAKKRVLPCPINGLADEELLRIFQHLPPYDRLRASEVCRRWNGLSRIPWRDVVHLDLNEIYGKSIGPIVVQCPNLQTVFASGRKLGINELNVFSQTNLSSIKLYHCSASIPEPSRDEDFDILSAVFSDDLANASWEELVLHDVSIVAGDDRYAHPIASSLPASLKRLQLGGIAVNDSDGDPACCSGCPGLSLNDLGRLQNLSCLILSSCGDNCLIENALLLEDDIFREMQTLKNLRELCLGFADCGAFPPVGFLSSLTRLAVLFLHNVDFEDDEDEEIGRLVTEHPSLRILVLTGLFDHEVTVPARRLYPNGFGSTPVPKLHVFVGKQASEKILFTKSSADALEVHPITERLPAFLSKAEIAPIFEDVWIAAQISEGEAQGKQLFKYDVVAATSFRVADNV